MSEFQELSRHSSHYMAGQIGVLLLGFLSFPLLTRLFSVAEYGLMSLVLKVMGMFVVFAKMGFQSSAVRFYEEHRLAGDPDELRSYYSTLFLGPLATSIGVTGVFVLGVELMPVSLVSLEVKRLLLLAAILISVRAMWSVLMGFLRVEAKTKVQNALEISIRATTVGLIGVFYFAWRELSLRSFFAIIIGVELAMALGLTAYLIRRRLLAIGKVNLEFFKTVLLFGMPFAVSEFSLIILDSGDRVLVQHYLGPVALGYYSAAYNISSQVQLSLVYPIGLALGPICMRLWATKGPEETQAFLSRSLNVFLMIAIGVYCVVSATSHDLVVILASQKFQEAHRLLPVLIAGLVVFSAGPFLSVSLVLQKKTSVLATQVVYACVLNIVLNMILLPRMGLMGAAVSTLLSYAVLVLLLARSSFRFLPLHIEYLAWAKYIAAAFGSAEVSSWIQFANPYWDLVSRGILSAMLYFGIVWMTDRRVRSFLKNRVRSDALQIRKSEEMPSLSDAKPGVLPMSGSLQESSGAE